MDRKDDRKDHYQKSLEPLTGNNPELKEAEERREDEAVKAREERLAAEKRGDKPKTVVQPPRQGPGVTVTVVGELQTTGPLNDNPAPIDREELEDAEAEKQAALVVELPVPVKKEADKAKEELAPKPTGKKYL